MQGFVESLEDKSTIGRVTVASDGGFSGSYASPRSWGVNAPSDTFDGSGCTTMLGLNSAAAPNGAQERSFAASSDNGPAWMNGRMTTREGFDRNKIGQCVIMWLLIA